jgi:6-phosphofructokinase 1
MRIASEAIPIIRNGIPELGETIHESPLAGRKLGGLPPIEFIKETDRILASARLLDLKKEIDTRSEPLSFELAGPRKRLFFEPQHSRAAIVTCGGLCPGLNDVVRSLVMTLHHEYGAREIYGIRYGFQGMVEGKAAPALRLVPDEVEAISNNGGTYLGTSRGDQDPVDMVDFLQRRKIDMLFCIGGDGTQRGALAIAVEAERRGYALSVVGLPKTIDNDIGLVEKTFGFDTAVSVAAGVLSGAHVEAKSERYGVAIVKLMGRESGFLATHAAIASGDVNFLLIPEVPFDLEGKGGFLEALMERVRNRSHALVVVAEGVAKSLQAKFSNCGPNGSEENPVFEDIGAYLKDCATAFFKDQGFPARVKYIDPSYVVRSLPAIPTDSIFCQNLAHHAVHAAMAGKTRLVVATRHGIYCHIPMEAVTLGRKFVDPKGDLWRSAIEVTGQGDLKSRQ